MRTNSSYFARSAVALGIAVSTFTPFGGVSSIREANAQDLLPRDNGIYSYHRAPRYRESESHPIRILAYLVHPIGWVAREGVFRPLSAFTSSTTFTRSFFGYREPFDFREPECFSSSDAVPDCRQVPPYTNIGGGPRDQIIGGAEEGSLVPGERQVFFPDVNFEFDKASLNDLGKGRVRQIAQLLASVPSLKVVIEGHADFKGTDEYNMSLGERRAQSVIAELTELGIDPNRLSPISYGEGKPIFTEEEDWARAVNRRVQFSVGGDAAPTETAAASDLPAAAE
ncbi:MAG: OmpA family protein [Bdellovibrionales bacterium]|nr:OmpA family protein [Bdellovibrionales bacterium]